MIFVHELQQETLLLVDSMIKENLTHSEIVDILIQKDCEFMVETRNGYTSKTVMEIHKRDSNGELHYTLVDLIKRRNGLAYWQTIKIS